MQTLCCDVPERSVLVSGFLLSRFPLFAAVDPLVNSIPQPGIHQSFGSSLALQRDELLHPRQQPIQLLRAMNHLLRINCGMLRPLTLHMLDVFHGQAFGRVLYLAAAADHAFAPFAYNTEPARTFRSKPARMSLAPLSPHV